MTAGMLEHMPFGWTEPNGMRPLQQRRATRSAVKRP
jgi:hypothetical protein